ncbi:early nodulin-like protein 4 [Castanea sativa]|uniref:early nodulin-like protein 4 n=1 Tax=Castanea sativa TaxID=21020 RepID=UPI003F64F05A
MKMALSYSVQGFILLLTASLLVVSEANTIVVGGSEGWRFGFNYTDWALRNSPFYINDTLVFKYVPPSDTSFAPSVYLLPDLWSYTTCDFRRAKLLANATQGSGEGFKIVLKQGRPYYFASSGHNGFHCSAGLMKFFAVPLPRGN